VTPRRRWSALVLAVGLLGTGDRAGGVTGDVRTIPTRPGVTQSFLLVRPAARPVATVVLFAGGNGALNLRGTGSGSPATFSCATARDSPGTVCWSPSSTRRPTGRMGSTAFARPPPTPTTFER